ncbi:hypothetical protein HRG_010128 [Hirsutella rhossiliensis]|uniref:Uncharacterized protein n=1 Tax=Hirsutella rhossiliensis TaxID=111463 RepID=A0A9P8SDB8_9HYPO|nr:uncharacterized protein HRG_10128 [Hirsutella rhossiliensis]KAH0958441.1 hypothetical protein HRG_10128 [Hirsutella rhossiliensis]
MIDDINALRAARAVIQSRDAVAALHSRGRTGKAKPSPPLSLRAAETKFRVSKSHIGRAVQQLLGQRDRGPSGRKPLLNDNKDDALRRDPDAMPPSDSWYKRWIEAHGELRKTIIKAIEKARRAVEASSIENIVSFFLRLREIIQDYNLGASDIWNEDECGIRIGSLRERVSVVIMRATRHNRPQVTDPGDRESCTLIGAANAIGDVMSPWLIFKTFPTESWASIDGPEELRFVRTDTGFSNAEVTLEWVHHFNKVSWVMSSKA